MGKDKEGEVGVTLIAQLLGLFLALLGEAATERLVANVPVRTEIEAPLQATQKSASTPNSNCCGPFEDILSEADHLRNVSERLEILAHKHVGIEEVMVVAGSIRDIAAVLDVFTVTRSSAGSSKKNAQSTPQNGYLN